MDGFIIIGTRNGVTDTEEEVMKEFIIIGNMNCITYKEVFPLIKERVISIGSPVKEYENTDRKFGNHKWITTFPIPYLKGLTLTATYDPEKYKRYDNYDAINVDRIKDIPCDYEGVMGVPITILEYDQSNIEIMRFGGNDLDKRVFEEYLQQGNKTHYGKTLLIYKDGDKWVMPYNRILIRILNKKKL